MHQSHNIPWHILSTHFKAKYDDRSVNPHQSHMTLKNPQDPAVQPALAHFVRKFTSTIRMFSDTERNKYPATFDAPTSGPLFSDALRDKYPEYLNAQNQDIAYWIAAPRYTMVNGAQGLRYDTSHGGLAEVIKVLIYENEMSTLLMLAQHPLIPIEDLHWLSWGHHFGWSRCKEEALSAYLFFNAAEALGLVEKGDYTRLSVYPGLLRTLSVIVDYPAQQIIHVEFFKDIGIHQEIVKLPWSAQQRELDNLAVHKDYERFQRYMKEVFEVLYRYDVVARECGLGDDPREPLNWDVDIARTVPLMGAVKVEGVYIQEENRWTHFLKAE